jgi:hypothetical protein
VPKANVNRAGREDLGDVARRGSRAPSPWSRAGAEPALDEVLADPIVLLVMDRDRLTAEDVRAVADRVGQRGRYAA